MHGLKLLHKQLEKSRPVGHQWRLEAVMKAVGSLLRGSRLTLTALGRGIANRVDEKHNIKCLDRLLGNPHLHGARSKVYGYLAQLLLSASGRPVIIVDWSDVIEGHEQLMLTAAVPLGGRALPIYEEVHPLRRYNSPRTHRRFLLALAEVVPAGVHPIIVTDAGFRGPWFRQVERLGWDWVGRVRNRIKYSLDEGRHWSYTQRLYRSATRRVRPLGWGWLSRKQPYGCHLYLVKATLRGRGRPKRTHRGDVVAERWRKLYKDPWLLATSLAHSAGAGKRVMKLYALRMQIEETYRDVKNGRWGFGLEYARSRRAQRLENLLLIATLALVVIWLTGLVAKRRQWVRHFQANTERRRPVLSVFFLGKRLLECLHFKISRQDIAQAFRELPLIASRQVEFVGIS